VLEVLMQDYELTRKFDLAGGGRGRSRVPDFGSCGFGPVGSGRGQTEQQNYDNAAITLARHRAHPHPPAPLNFDRLSSAASTTKADPHRPRHKTLPGEG
jgi:hypothetical protein